MTLLKFSKTRVVYWDANPSALKLPANANTIPDGVGLYVDNKVAPYMVYQISPNKHNWHIVPYNHFGCYMNPAELNAVYENSNSFYPKSCSMIIGHTIPLTKNATANSTQLSFNNTIYSLIYDMPGNDHVTAGTGFNNAQEADAFFRTFDGSKATDLKRNLLPSPLILFKVPRVKNEKSFDVIQRPYEENKENPQYKPFYEESKGLEQGYTQASMVNAYLPEIMQDNHNVKTLYPGENQDTFHVDLTPYKTYSTIACDSLNFNETFANIDVRAAQINSNTAFPNSLFLWMSIVPSMRGPTDMFSFQDVGLVDTPYCSKMDINTAQTTLEGQNFALWSEILKSHHGERHESTFLPPLPNKFIKCLPIMAQDDVAIAHTICGTVTWFIEIECTERMYKHINPYKWEMVWPMRYLVNKKFDKDGLLTSNRVRETFISSQGMRPLHDNHWKQLQYRLRGANSLDPTNIINPNTDNAPIPLAASRTVDGGVRTDTGLLNLPIDFETEQMRWTPAALNDLHTASFQMLYTGPQTRSRTKQASKQAKTSK